MWSKRFLLAFGIAMIGIGCAYLSFPLALVGLSEIALTSPPALIDARAMYGGVQIGIGAFILLCAMRPQMMRTGLLFIVILLVPVVAARLIGMKLDGSPGPVIGTGLATEIIGIFLALGLLLRERVSANERGD